MVDVGDLPRMAGMLLSFGLVCVAFGVACGYVLMPGVVRRCRRFVRGSRR